jgi:hypothetical protein
MYDMTDVFECVKCGYKNTVGAPACDRCSWPFSIKRWRLTNFKIHRLTIDTGCINAKRKDPDLNKLEDWKTQELLKVEIAFVLLKELKGENRLKKAQQTDSHPGLFILGASALSGGNVLAGPNIPTVLRQILFPTVSSLNTRQENDVEHLRAHIQVGADVFVTKNTADFIKNGKQQQLASIGVWVFQPSELVSLLKELYKWD